MNLTAAPISITAAALGLLCLAALYALHHLRIQPQRLPAATLLFWRRAVRPQQTRVPWSRQFTHRKTFLLLAATLTLIALALTADRWGHGNTARREVIVVDAGMATAADDGAGHALLRTMTDAARRDVLRMPQGVALIVAGPRPQVLTDASEPTALAARQLDAMSPAEGASASLLALEMAGGVLGDRDGIIHWYTLERELPAGLPESVSKRVALHMTRSPDAVAICGMTFESSAADAAVGTLHVRLGGTAASPVTLAADIGGRRASPRTISVGHVGTDVAFGNLAADGATVRLELQNAPGPTATHSAVFRLPDGRPLTFRVGDDLPKSVRAALLTAGTIAADGGIFVSGEGVTPPATAKAAIVIVDHGPAVPHGATLHLDNTSATRGLDLETAVAADGPALGADVTSVISADGATVAGFGRVNNLPTLYLSRSLVSPTADLPKHAAFPVLIARLCDALVGRTKAPLVLCASRLAEDPLWKSPADAPATGVVRAADQPTAAAEIPSPMPVARSLGSMSWTTAVLLGALVLLSVDAALRAARKIV